MATSLRKRAFSWIYRRHIPGRLLSERIGARACSLARAARSAAQSGPSKAILYPVRHTLALGYAIEHARLLADCSDAAVFFTSHGGLAQAVRDAIQPNHRGWSYVSLPDALTRNWDLVIFTAHYHGAMFDPGATKIFVPHGIEAGPRALGGVGYTYGWQAMWDRDKTYYSAMFASSPVEIDMARSEYGEAVASRVIVSGEVVACKLVDLNRCRREVRTDLGLIPSEIVVAVMSSWGDGSLLDRYHDRLLGWIREAPRNWQVWLFVHPHNYASRRSRRTIDSLSAAGVQLVPPAPSVAPDAWFRHIVAADIAISDRTSLSLYFSLLNKPVIYCRMDDALFMPSSALMKVYARSPVLADRAPFVQQVRGALDRFEPMTQRQLIEDLFPHVGDYEHARRTLGAVLTRELHARRELPYDPLGRA